MYTLAKYVERTLVLSTNGFVLNTQRTRVSWTFLCPDWILRIMNLFWSTWIFFFFCFFEMSMTLSFLIQEAPSTGQSSHFLSWVCFYKQVKGLFVFSKFGKFSIQHLKAGDELTFVPNWANDLSQEWMAIRLLNSRRILAGVNSWSCHLLTKQFFQTEEQNNKTRFWKVFGMILFQANPRFKIQFIFLHQFFFFFFLLHSRFKKKFFAKWEPKRISNGFSLFSLFRPHLVVPCTRAVVSLLMFCSCLLRVCSQTIANIETETELSSAFFVWTPIKRVSHSVSIGGEGTSGSVIKTNRIQGVRCWNLDLDRLFIHEAEDRLA